MNSRWAALRCFSNNLGDDVQTLAAVRHLPAIDRLLVRDELLGEDLQETMHHCIFNGWFLWGAEWPPPPLIDPLLISMHVSSMPSTRQAFSSGAAIEWLAKQGPVGCRSHDTLAFFQSLGVEAYFSGCLTLTLERPDVPPNEMIAWVDVQPPGWGQKDHLEQFELMECSIIVTHKCHPGMTTQSKLDTAQRLLGLYAGATAVVTNRLHVALPCIAFGTPVLFIMPDYEAERIESYLPMMSSVMTPHEFHSKFDEIDFFNLPPPSRPVELIGNLNRRVKDWISSRH